MERVECSADPRALRSLLEKSPEVLGETKDPTGWLLLSAVKPEESEESESPIDFLFADPDGSPTFVSWRSFSEGQSRHEMMGRLLDYAVSAGTEWSVDRLREEASDEYADLNVAVQTVTEIPVDDYLAQVHSRLQEGRLRLLLMSEGFPGDIQNIVEFLDAQMEKLSIGLVKVDQYQANGFSVLMPSVLRQATMPVLESSAGGEEAGSEDRWDEKSFFEEVGKQLAPDQAKAIRTLIQSASKLHFNIMWGMKDESASFGLQLAQLADDPLLSLHADGTLFLGFGATSGLSGKRNIENKFRAVAHDRLGVVFHLDDRNPSMTPTDWCPKVTGVLRILDDLVAAAPRESK